jgi:phage protein D
MNARSDFDTLAPEFTVQVNGAALPNEAMADLIGLTVLEDVEAAGMFSLTLTGWDTVQMKPKWIDDKLFREGNPVEIGFGYRDRKEALMTGEITAIEPEFAEAQPPTLTVRGHDLRHRLMRARRTRTFTQCKDSDIASRIASEAGLKPQTDDSRVMLPYVLQHNQTDLEFLGARAARIGYELVVQDRTLMFRQRGNRRVRSRDAAPRDRAPVVPPATVHLRPGARVRGARMGSRAQAGTRRPRAAQEVSA